MRLRSIRTALMIAVAIGLILSMGVVKPRNAVASHERFINGAKYLIQNRYTGKCIAISSSFNYNGQPAIEYTCHLDWPDQQWKIAVVDTSYSGSVVMSLANQLHKEKCLSYPPGDYAYGRSMVQWDCDGGNRQLVSVMPVYADHARREEQLVVSGCLAFRAADPQPRQLRDFPCEDSYYDQHWYFHLVPNSGT
jgi:hypothetical protein